jgi:hypothetical protein
MSDIADIKADVDAHLWIDRAVGSHKCYSGAGSYRYLNCMSVRKIGAELLVVDKQVA